MFPNVRSPLSGIAAVQRILVLRYLDAWRVGKDACAGTDAYGAIVFQYTGAIQYRVTFGSQLPQATTPNSS